MVSSEKYNLDQSSGDNSMEEDDALESKSVVPKSSPDEVVDRKMKTEVPVVEAAAPAGDMQGDISVDNEDSHDDTKNAPDAPTVKRMLHGKLVGFFFPVHSCIFVAHVHAPLFSCCCGFVDPDAMVFYDTIY